jgi:hypothetical protein
MIIGRYRDGDQRYFVHGGSGVQNVFVTLWINGGRWQLLKKEWTDAQHKSAEFARTETIRLWSESPTPNVGYQCYYVNTGAQWRGDW